MGSKSRPPPLRINKESQRIRKPPLRLPVIQHRQPTIIHACSPRVIQTDPNNFMSLVQRLTGQGMETGCSVDANDRFVITPTALPGTVFSASPDIHASGMNLERVNLEILVPPRSSLHEVNAHETVLREGYEHSFTLTPGPLLLRSPASSYSILASPRLWSPIPTPNMMSQRFLADLPSLSPRKQSPSNNLVLPSPQNGAIASPRLWSPIPTPNISSQRFLADLPCLSLQRQEHVDNLLSPSPRLLSPRSRYGAILPAPRTLA